MEFHLTKTNSGLCYDNSKGKIVILSFYNQTPRTRNGCSMSYGARPALLYYCLCVRVINKVKSKGTVRLSYHVHTCHARASVHRFSLNKRSARIAGLCVPHRPHSPSHPRPCISRSKSQQPRVLCVAIPNINTNSKTVD